MSKSIVSQLDVSSSSFCEVAMKILNTLGSFIDYMKSRQTNKKQEKLNKFYYSLPVASPSNRIATLLIGKIITWIDQEKNQNNLQEMIRND